MSLQLPGWRFSCNVSSLQSARNAIGFQCGLAFFLLSGWEDGSGLYMSALKPEIIKCFNEEVYEQINKSKK